jgi:hypothetical protein
MIHFFTYFGHHPDLEDRLSKNNCEELLKIDNQSSYDFYGYKKLKFPHSILVMDI